MMENKHPKSESSDSEKESRETPPAAPTTEESPAAIETDKTEIADLKDKLLRCLAEADNLRKRTIREKEEASKFAIHRFASELLSIPDNLERAIKSFEATTQALSPEIEKLLEGIRITEKEFFNVLQRHQIQKLSPEQGEKFDPHVHEAMFEVETEDHPVGTVVQLVQAGYLLHGRLLRPALVGVAKPKNSEQQENPDSSSS